MITPQYAENIIVGIKHKNKFGWYILNKFLCLLNLNKLNSQDFKLYMQSEENKNIRIDYKQIDNTNIENFLEEIDIFKIKPENLQLMILDSVKDIVDNFLQEKLLYRRTKECFLPKLMVLVLCLQP